MNYKSIYNEINARLRTVRRKETGLILGYGAFTAISIILAFTLLITIVETIAQGDVAFRTFLASMFAVVALASLAWFLYPGLARLLGTKLKPSLELMALRIGEFYPDVRDNLCNALQLANSVESPNGSSPELALAAFETTVNVAKDKDFDVVLEKKQIKKGLIFFMISSVLFLGSFGIFSGTLGASLNRLYHFNKSFLPPAPFSITIEPLKANVLRGGGVKIIVKATGIAPETINLKIKELTQENFDNYVLRIDSGKIYTYEISSLKNSITFYAEAKWLTSAIVTELGTINVIDRPLVRSMAGLISFPTYTGLSPKQFDEQSADVSGLKGSNVSLNVVSNKDLQSAELVLLNSKNAADSSAQKDTMHIAMKIEGKKAYGSFKITQNGSYFVNIKDKDGQTNADPINYTVVALTDEFPTISLLSPVTDVKVNRDALLPIKAAISDDYGFATLKIYYKLIETKYGSPDKNFKVIQIPIVSRELAQEIPYLWDLQKIGITPDDKYEFYMEVADNDALNGYKTSKTQTLTFKLPSMDETLDEADKSQDKVEKELQKVMNETEKVQKQIAEFNRELLKNQDPNKQLNYNEKKQAQDILKKQAELSQKMDDLQKQMQQTANNLQQNNLLSPETMQKYMELQKLMQEVKAPELEKWQKQMEQAMDKMSPDQMKKAMNEAKFNEERFKKSIERTMKILKRIQAEQKADALTKRAEEMEKKQNESAKQLENSNSGNEEKRKELAKQQERMRDELKSMDKDMKELEKLMKEIGEKEMPMKEFKEAEKALNSEETSQDMQDAQQDMQKGEFNKAAQKQKKSAQTMKNFANKMKNMKDEMKKKVSKEAERKMQKAINDMLELSKEQEQLKNKTQKSDPSSTQVPKFAQDQAETFENTANVANSLMELGEKSFAVTPEMGAEVGSALQQMRASVDYLSNRMTSQAAQAQAQAMQSMNNAIGQMQSSLSQMKKKGNGSCDNPGGEGQGQSGAGGGQGGMSPQAFQQKMQQMAAEQQAIKESLEKAMQGGQGGQGGANSQEQRAQMSRLADKQGNAQKSMEELAKEQKQFADGEKKTLGSLDKIAQEMKEVVEDIKSGRANQETLKKQEKILSRLLDATKSLSDRDFEKKRESASGKDYNLKSPGALDLKTQEGRNRAMQELLKSLQNGYTKDYEQLIRKYFEGLQSAKK